MPILTTRGIAPAIRFAALAIALVVAVPQVATGQPAPVVAVTAETGRVVERLRLNGTVVAPVSALVSSELGGIVARMAVDLGDPVAAGDPLVQLDAGLARLEVRQAAAASREAREALDYARRRLADAEELSAQNNIARNEVETRASEVRIAEAALDSAEAQEEWRRERVARRTVRAPFDGVVVARATEVGEWIEPGTTVVELVAVDRLVVDVPVPQRHYAALGDGAELSLTFDALPGERFEGEIVTRVPVSDPTARTFTLRLLPDAPTESLTPGMSADVTIGLAGGREGILVPRDAVMRYPDGRTTVWVVGSGGDGHTVSERQVTLGRAFDGVVHVADGLAAGERIVTRGNEGLTEDQEVRLAGEEG